MKIRTGLGGGLEGKHMLKMSRALRSSQHLKEKKKKGKTLRKPRT
jgi:hypothetical protein